MLALLVATLSLTACRADQSNLRLSFAVAPDDSSGFTALRFEPTWGGVNRGPLRDENWTRVPVVASSVEWPDASAPDRMAPVLMARGTVPAGDYLRVYVETPRVTGVAADGTATTLEAHIEPMVFPVVVTDDAVTDVVIDLIILPLPHWRGPGYGIFVKSVHWPPRR